MVNQVSSTEVAITAIKSYDQILSTIKIQNVPAKIQKLMMQVQTARGSFFGARTMEDLIESIDLSSVSDEAMASEIILDGALKEYDRTLYANIKEATLAHLASESAGSVVASKVFYQLYKSKILFSDTKEMYEFSNHGWNPCSINALNSKVVTELPELLESFADILHRRTINSDFEMTEVYSFDVWQRGCENVLSMVEICKSSYRYISDVVVLIRNLSTLASFDSLRDSLRVLRFEDGVFDPFTQIFRDGKPEDFCVTKFPIKFRTPYPVSHETMLMAYLNRVFPDKSVLDYFLAFVASCFQSGNKEKVLCIFKGPSNGGKTFICNLLSSFFGNYCTRIPITALSGKRVAAGRATPELALLDRHLIAITQEPSGNEILNLGLIKELTGNESDIYVRRLFKEGTQMRVTCKIIVSMNPVTIATDIDKASENRIRVIPFDSLFVNDPKEVDESKNIFALDVDAGQKIPDMLPPMLAIVRRYYEDYVRNGITTPRSIMDATAKFVEENEPIVQFLGRYKKCDVGVIHTSHLWENYKSWYHESFPNAKLCNIKKFCSVLRDKGISVNGDGLSGFVVGIVAQ